MRSCVLGFATALVAQTAFAAAPAPTPPQPFKTVNYALTFRAPPGTTYCPIPEDWTGSDHGTTVFLTPPLRCDGVGYPSSSRGFEPEATPRIEVYYGNSMIEDDQPPPHRPCRQIGRMRFLGHATNLCRIDGGPLLAAEVSGQYRASSRAEAIVALVTTRRRWAHDMVAFRAILRSTRPCVAVWHYEGGRVERLGQGALCPADGRFY